MFLINFVDGRKGKKEKEKRKEERRKKPINPTNIIFWSVKKLQFVSIKASEASKAGTGLKST